VTWRYETQELAQIIDLTLELGELALHVQDDFYTRQVDSQVTSEVQNRPHLFHIVLRIQACIPPGA
jgi:hypothetical protein